MNEAVVSTRGQQLLTYEEICTASRGNPVFLSGTRGYVSSVSIDSRSLGRDCLFVPLKGERADGHDFIEDAVAGGASAVLIEKRVWEKQASRLVSLAREKDTALCVVDDTLAALQDIAAYYIGLFPELYKIGVTGSNGKTTTKEIIGSILSCETDTVINEGNLNSEIGLPLSVFSIRSGHRYAVFEMGMNHTGEMDVLAGIVKPDAALITNIGIAHIGILGTKDAIAQEKKKIFKYCNGSQKGFLYEKEPYRGFLMQNVKAEFFFYGPGATKGLKGYEDLGLDGIIIHWEEFRILYPFFGFHNLLNALGAISLAVELGIRPANVKEGLESVKPLFGRSQIIRGGLTIIEDCYNANPDSVTEVLRFLRDVRWKGRKIVILGSMRELGAEKEDAHRRIAAESAGMGFDMVCLFGDEFEEASLLLEKARCGPPLFWTSDFDRLREHVLSSVRQGDVILLKGSRGVELERLVPDLMKL
ncbi:MAG: UDP-N-acetylmuramoyl-tripeptide--D-alanyl-D-alanine ligase [Spirochaetales bacterium]|nr:UDP-N-acetylmuramoyl-tripeptide--D-alanyl-D-alanine ligase [Spirochaetales bacterium]